MLRFSQNGLPLWHFADLEGRGDPLLAVTGNAGGPDRPPYGAFNLGLNGDDPGAVARNRERLRAVLGLKELAQVKQVHGTRMVAIQGGEPSPAGEADGLMTDRPGVGLLIKQADCQAVALWAPGRAVANFHVGWRGNRAGFPGRAVAEFCARYGLAPGELSAAIAPSLGPCCAEFVNYRREWPEEFWRYLVKGDHLDLWTLTRDQLAAAGVDPARIHLAGVCTKCGPGFYSHRRGEKGRFATVVALAREAA